MVARDCWNLQNQELNDDDDDDYEEALSLRDLAEDNGDSCAWNDSLKDDQSSSFDHDLFEFFSEDFTSSSAFPEDNIVFCGKLIPYKGEKEDGHVRNSDNDNRKQKAGRRSWVFTWKPFSLNGSRSGSMKRYGDKYDVSMKQVSVLASPARPRWYLFAFGMGRYPMEMDLNDIKTRKSKLSDGKIVRQSTKSTSSAMFRQTDDNNREMGKRRSGKREKSWWSLVRILGCKSNHANAMVKASIGLLPLPR